MNLLLGCGRAGNTQEMLGSAALGAQTELLQVCSEPAVGPEQRQCVLCKCRKYPVLVPDIPQQSKKKHSKIPAQ